MTNRRCILLNTRNPDRAKAWESWLGSTGLGTLSARQFLTMTMAQVSELPDMVVAISDEPLDLTQLGFSRCRVARGEVCLVTVGCDVPADVNLPADATSGELQLACRMLAQISALRSELAREREGKSELQQLVESDPLTKLPNRRAWDAQLQSVDSRYASDDGLGNLVVAMFDVDGFKQCNDRHGHAAADDRLAEVAHLLANAIRRQDFVARWGGDEFALLLADVPPQRAPEIVERIRQAATLSGASSLTLSAGWAIVSVENGCPATTEAWKAADKALRDAKLAGGDQTRGGTASSQLQMQAAAG